MLKYPFKSFVLILLLLMAATGISRGQIRGGNGLKWYSFNASGGFLMPISPYNVALAEGAQHQYRFSGIPGFTFSLAKLVNLQLNIGAELEDHRIDGKINFNNDLGRQLYNARLRTYSLYVQYYIFERTNINFFFLGKAGYSGVNRTTTGEDLSRTIPADMWEWVFTGGYGVTWHLDPHFSVNLYGEFSPVPTTYLKDMYASLGTPDKKLLPMTRIVFSITGNSDVRIYYPFRFGRLFGAKFKNDNVWPFHKIRRRL